MRNFFITGTDTDVGKTYVTCALLRDLRARGLSALGYKPIACGDRSDARVMRDATNPSMSLESINPVYLRAATAPYIAAELERRELKLEPLIEAYEALAATTSPILVEGAGGWVVPLAPGIHMSDLAKELALPVILVVGNKLGAVNHTLLTIKAIEADGLECAGIILNHIGEEWSTATLTNRRLIEQFAPHVPILAELIHGQEDIDSTCLDSL